MSSASADIFLITGPPGKSNYLLIKLKNGLQMNSLYSSSSLDSQQRSVLIYLKVELSLLMIRAPSLLPSHVVLHFAPSPRKEPGQPDSWTHSEQPQPLRTRAQLISGTKAGSGNV